MKDKKKRGRRWAEDRVKPVCESRESWGSRRGWMTVFGLCWLNFWENGKWRYLVIGNFFLGGKVLVSD